MKSTPTTEEAASLLAMIATGLIALAIGKVRHRLDENDEDPDDPREEVPIPIE